MTCSKDAADEVASLCINVCHINESNGLCRGCLRTLPEIANWGRASNTERRAIVAAVEQRRNAAKNNQSPN